MGRTEAGTGVANLWKRAREGDYRQAIAGARVALRLSRHAGTIDLRLIVAFCSMRQGHHAEAHAELSAARRAAQESPRQAAWGARVDAWAAELAYMQGRYADANALLDRALPVLEREGERADLAFALRVRIAILLARAEYEAGAGLAARAIRTAEESGDDFVLVQVLNILGALYFDRATSKLRTPHARAHLSGLESVETAPLEEDARVALQLFKRAYDIAVRAGNTFAAWYVGGNIERLEILLGRADRAVRPLRRRIRALHDRGATYDEIVARSNLAWALRSLGRHEESLHELEVAMRLARNSGVANVLLEFLEYDRSIVLDGLGDRLGARASYRRYRQLVGLSPAASGDTPSNDARIARKQVLEPYYLKRADRFIVSRLGHAFSVADLAGHCGVSSRTLEKGFSDFRDVTPVAYIRNLRLDAARKALLSGDGSVQGVAVNLGFRSVTTFASEYRRRFGVPPSHSLPRGGASGDRATDCGNG